MPGARVSTRNITGHFKMVHIAKSFVFSCSEDGAYLSISVHISCENKSNSLSSLEVCLSIGRVNDEWKDACSTLVKSKETCEQTCLERFLAYYELVWVTFPPMTTAVCYSKHRLCC